MFLDTRIYFLCVSQSNNSRQRFTCEQFESFNEANYYYTKLSLTKLKEQHVSQIVPICRYTPSILQTYYLNKKLSENMVRTSVGTIEKMI